jgi:very-short-patch-repair endonuclease
MNYKLEYITRIFEKTSKKRIENYVVTRIWHLLNNDDVHMIPQQYVYRQSEQYALTDLYFPQVNLHVEVNEPAHYKSQENINADLQRKKEIEQQTGHVLRVIDCREPLIKIHEQIDGIINEINSVISEQKKNGLFQPWRPDIERTPEYWRNKKNISIEDDLCLNNIEDICKLFSIDPNKTKRGFLRLGGIMYSQEDNLKLWWPSEKSRQGWINKLDLDSKLITETHTDLNKRSEHFAKYKKTKEKRIVFFHHKDLLGLVSYKFMGVYCYDTERSKPEIGTVWKLHSNTFER